MAERTAPRVTRLLGLVSYLERFGEATFADLGERFGVAPEQIRRDVELLWVSGIPGHGPEDLIDFDGWAFDDGIARLLNSQGVYQMRLAPREAIALIGALSAVVASGAAPDSAASALAKIQAAVGDVGVIGADAAGGVSSQVRDAVLEAIGGARALQLTYVDASDRRSERMVEPHRLVLIEGATYLECFCRRAQDYRTLRLDRMLDASIADVVVEHPPSEQVGFSLVPRFTGVVEAARRARWVFDAIPGCTIEDDGESITATFDVADADVVAGEILLVAPHVRHIAPPELALALERKAASVALAQGLY